MADQRIQYSEEMVGAGHPTKADTINRLALVEHNNDGTHKYKKEADIREYLPAGFVTDGSVDYTAGLNAALAAATEINIPKGTWLVTGDTLAGQSGSVIYFAPGAVLRLATTVASKTLLSFTGKTNIVLVNPTFDLNQAGAISNIGLKIDGSSNVRIINSRFINSAITRNWPTTVPYGYGIYLLNAWEDVKVESIYSADIMYPVITEPSSTGNHLTVSKGRMEYLGGDGVEINVPTGSCENVEVEGVTFYKVGGNNASRGFGVGMSGGVGTTIKRVDVHDNNFIQCDNQGVHIEDGCEAVNIHDNDFDICGEASAAAYGSAVYVAVTNATRLSKKIKVNHNTVKGGASSDYGLYFGGSQTTNDVECRGNTVEMAGVGVPIYFASMRNFRINDNTAKNGLGSAGISVRSGYGTVKGNRCYDDQGTKTQTYGIEYNSGADYVVFENNILTDNATGAFNELSAPDGARFVNNIEAADQLVGFAVKSGTANTVGSYKIDGPIAYQQRRAVADAAYSMTRYDSYIAYTSLTAGRQVTIPVTNIQAGHEVVIKDEAGAAGTYNITIVPNSGTIDGAASVAISANYGLKRLRWNGTTWFTV